MTRGAGCRIWTDDLLIYNTLAPHKGKIKVVIEGEARGADTNWQSSIRFPLRRATLTWRPSSRWSLPLVIGPPSFFRLGITHRVAVLLHDA